MKLSKAIDRLEVGETVWVKATVDRINNEGKYIRVMPNASSVYLDGNDEISLTKPDAEKVEVPDFVAEWYESHRGDLEYDLFVTTVAINNLTSKDDEAFEKWFDSRNTKPYETIIKMKLFGYTVKPKRWVVKYLRHRCYYYFVEWASTDTFDPIGGPDLDYLKVAEFTDRAKAEAVATLVEGSVEEV